MEPQSSSNGAKMEAKWTPNGAKLDALFDNLHQRPPRPSKSTKNELKTMPKWGQNELQECPKHLKFDKMLTQRFPNASIYSPGPKMVPRALRWAQNERQRRDIAVTSPKDAQRRRQRQMNSTKTIRNDTHPCAPTMLRKQRYEPPSFHKLQGQWHETARSENAAKTKIRTNERSLRSSLIAFPVPLLRQVSKSCFFR